MTLEMKTPTTIVNPKMLSEVQENIVTINGIPVIADADVAYLYGVETKRVNEAVRNNPDKFPPDYMFELSAAETTFFADEYFDHKSFPEEQEDDKGIHGERTVYARYNPKKQKRIGCDICHYRDLRKGAKHQA